MLRCPANNFLAQMVSVSDAALLGLKEIIAREESKPRKELKTIFPEPIVVYDSYSTSCWERFWNEPPSAVGIDTEGNQISPPVLVQISTESYTILEAPTNGRLSDNLIRLLKDDNITKGTCNSRLGASALVLATDNTT